jgi:hypothetical protein
MDIYLKNIYKEFRQKLKLVFTLILPQTKNMLNRLNRGVQC